jgi:hypothetical protein
LGWRNAETEKRVCEKLHPTTPLPFIPPRKGGATNQAPRSCETRFARQKNLPDLISKVGRYSELSSASTDCLAETVPQTWLCPTLKKVRDGRASRLRRQSGGLAGQTAPVSRLQGEFLFVPRPAPKAMPQPMSSLSLPFSQTRPGQRAHREK